MAIVSLGRQLIDPVRLPFDYAPFVYNNTRAYLIFCDIFRDFSKDIFSTIDITAKLDLTPIDVFFLANLQRYDLLRPRYIFFLPFSGLVPSNRDCILQVTRFPVFRGGADAEPLEVEISYEDTNTVPTWLN